MIKHRYDFSQVEVPEALLQAEVTQEEMDAEYRSAARQFTAIVAAEGPVQAGDVVTLTFADEKAESGQRTIYANVGKGFTDEEELVMGRSLGECIRTRYAGRNVEAAIVCCKRLQVPALTDDLAAQLGLENVTDLASFEAYVFAKLAEIQRKRKFRGIMGIVSKAMMEKSEFTELEESHPWYQALHGRMMGRIRAFAEQSGISEEEAMPTALRMEGKSIEECSQALKAMCVERARQAALGQSYAQEKGAVIEEEDTAERIGAYVEYLNEVVYEHFAPRIRVSHP